MPSRGNMNRSVHHLRKVFMEKYTALATAPEPSLPSKQYLAWADDPLNPFVDGRKTLAMRLLESHFGKPIEELLSLDKAGRDIARRLGITESAVSKWRKRMGLIP